MAIASELQTSFNDAVNNYGQQLIVMQRTMVFDDVYDEGSTFTVTGSAIGSAVIMPVSENKNGVDFQYLERGAINLQDLKCFIQSGIAVDEDDLIRLSNPIGSYNVVMLFPWPLEGTTIYQKLYIRKYTQQ